VETLQAEKGENRIVVEAMGTVQANQEIALNPEVSGLVVWKNPNLIAGGIMEEGEALLRIDSRNYEVAVKQAESGLEQARVEYQLELSRASVASEEWEMIGPEQGDSDLRSKSLALREPQLQAAKSRLLAASNALFKAELDLERTEIEAPFNAVVLEEFVDRGQLVSPQTRIASLAGTDAFLVKVSLPAGSLKYMDWPDAEGQGGPAATIEYDQGEAGTVAFQGQVVRVLGNLSATGRLAHLLIEVEDPLNLEGADPQKRLYKNAYVRCLIKGREIEDTVKLPSELLREGEKVWIMGPDNKLEIREVDVYWRQGGHVLIAEGVEDGEKVVSSHIALPMPGMTLKARER